MKRALLIVVIALLVMPFTSTLLAQDDDNQARIDSALESLNSAENFTLSTQETNVSDLILSIGDETSALEFGTLSTVTIDATHVVFPNTEGGPNINTTGTLVQENRTTIFGSTTDVSISYDFVVRYVDGVVYMRIDNVATVGDEEEIDFPPEGWFIVENDDTYDFDGFDTLEIDRYLDYSILALTGADFEIDTLSFGTGDITVTAETLDSGEAVERITVPLDSETLASLVGLASLLGTEGEEDPFDGMGSDFISDFLSGIDVEAAFLLDEEDALVGLEYSQSVGFDALDVSQFNTDTTDSPFGDSQLIINGTQSATIVARVDAVNTGVVSVLAPELNGAE